MSIFIFVFDLMTFILTFSSVSKESFVWKSTSAVRLFILSVGLVPKQRIKLGTLDYASTSDNWII